MEQGKGFVAKKFFILGAPDAGKRKLANGLMDRFPQSLIHQSETTIYDNSYAVDGLADYRVETKIAADRATRPKYFQKPTSVLYTHSLLDSLIYSTLRYERVVAHENVDEYLLEKAVMVMTLAAAFIRDTFEYDHVFFLLTDHEDKKAFESLAKNALDGFEIDHTVLRGDEQLQWVDQAATILEGYLNGQRYASVEPALSQD